MRTQEEVNRRINILLTLGSSLIGEVSKNLRLVSIEWDDTSSKMYFCFDYPIQEREGKIAERVHSQFISHFSKDRTNQCTLKIAYIPEPEEIPYPGTVVFARKEQYD